MEKEEKAQKVEEPDFTIGDIIGEIQGELTIAEDFEPDETGFYTSNEISDVLGLNVRKVRVELRKLKRDGRLEVGKKSTRLLDDNIRGIQAYRLIIPKEVEEG